METITWRFCVINYRIFKNCPVWYHAGTQETYPELPPGMALANEFVPGADDIVLGTTTEIIQQLNQHESLKNAALLQTTAYLKGRKVQRYEFASAA